MMKYALQLAMQGAADGEVPVGAVLVCDGQIIGKGYNRPISTHDATAHAEIVAIRQACKVLDNYRLPADCTLYVTLEPCTMCFGAMVHARVGRVVFGAYEPKAGVMTSQLSLPTMTFYNHQISVQGGLLGHDCGALLSAFFRGRRVSKKGENVSTKD
ncbi:MAG: tRNA adenosine(34) deaminase TadA [Moraxella sp.]|nr:tRNA adenosine(34) deaminase TadA [Moraxella sp.]